MGAAAIAKLVNILRIMFMAKAGLFLAKCLTFFGLGFAVSKFAIEPATDQLRAIATQGPSGSLGGTVLEWAGVIQLDTALSMLLSAYAAAWTIKTTKAFLMQTT